MSNYKRLTEKKVNGTTERYIRVDKDYILSAYDIIDEEKQDFVEMIIDRLAELEDKIENGTLIELPCKVGDTVYCIYDNGVGDYWIEEEIVHDFIFTNDEEIDIGTECRMIGRFYRDGVFLTKAEAEQKLLELKKGK